MLVCFQHTMNPPEMEHTSSPFLGCALFAVNLVGISSERSGDRRTGQSYTMSVSGCNIYCNIHSRNLKFHLSVSARQVGEHAPSGCV